MKQRKPILLTLALLLGLLAGCTPAPSATTASPSVQVASPSPSPSPSPGPSSTEIQDNLGQRQLSCITADVRLDPETADLIRPVRQSGFYTHFYAFNFDPQFDELLLASKEATYAGIREAGVDARLGEIGGVIEEVISSHEVTIRGTTYPIRPVRNLSGHTVAQGTIHAGKSVPLIRGRGEDGESDAEEGHERMLEGEVYAIETFASTGQGMVIENGECSHFALVPEQYAALRTQKAKALLAHIRKTFGTLPFCPRWLVRPDGGSFAVNGDKGQQKMYHGALRSLVEQGVVRDYLPLSDHRGSYVSQWEHTLILKSHSKEVLSWGTDY